MVRMEKAPVFKAVRVTASVGSSENMVLRTSISEFML